jgi:serine/threonine-protein kinase
MGEVYRARDAKLNRDVALKVLPDAFALDPDRLARFQREAQVLASLNHPHIGAIYGFEDSGSTHALVLELVEGPTLADRIAQGPMSLDGALPIARQIAEALEAAHSQGVIHRDLKPANIKLTSSGKVKVLDFGLAKMLETDRASSSLSMSPTIGVHATYAGVILGTASYMSPEQARGKALDQRTDIWSFGCVLFEMLTGRKTFDAGETVSEAVAAILTRDPDWTALPSGLPSSVRTALRRCLQKDPERRLHHIADARLELEEPGASLEALPAGAAPARSAPLWLRVLPWAIAVLALAAAAVWTLWRPPLVPSNPAGSRGSS